MDRWWPLRRWRATREPWRSLAKGLGDAGLGGERVAGALFVPGRVELLGKHTDYAGGRSLVTATPQGLCVLVAPRSDSRLCWYDLGRGLEARFDAADPGERPGHWSNYLRTPVRRALLNFGPPRRGLDAAMMSDLPAAAGLSSSSALVVAAFLALDAANDLAATHGYRAEIRDEIDLAGYLGAVENGLAFKGLRGAGGVGTSGGSEDHAAILGSRAGRLRQYGFGPLRLEREIALPSGWALVVATSGVRAKKTGAARERYNRLATLATKGAAAWRRATHGDEQHLGAALSAAGSAARLISEVETGLAGESSAREVRDRVAQFAEESGSLVPEAAAFFEAGDGRGLGRVVDRSQRLAEELLRNQVPETRALARLARDSGALAASAFGAGFGGAVWAIVERQQAWDFSDVWRAGYAAAFPDAAGDSRVFTASPGRGAYWPAIDSASRGGDDPEGGGRP